MSEKHILSRHEIADTITFTVDMNCPHCKNIMVLAGDGGSLPTNDLKCTHPHCNLDMAMDEDMQLEFDLMLESIRRVLKKYREKITQ